FVSKLYGYSIVRPLQAAIRARGDEVAWFVHGVSNEHLRNDEKQLHSVAEVKAYNPHAVFVSSNWVPDFFPGAKIELFHGFNAEKRDEHVGHFRIRGGFDLYCTQGPSTTPTFQELAKQHRYFRAIETGWPKVDLLFRDLFQNLYQDNEQHDLCEQRGIEKPIVLYTSTFSRRLTAAPRLLDTIAQLSKAGRWHWLVNLHPKMDAGIVERYKALEGPNLNFIDTDNIIPLLKAADVMVSDTSSVVFEFMLQDKPVITCRHRNPGPHLLNIQEASELESTLETALTRPDELMSKVRQYADWLHPYRDGRSSERVLDATEAFLANDYGQLKRKPLNIGRRISTRKKLGYWRW
ncbi:MAG: CDP-glycerol glycerophosphotransferase family protein, partial [Ectothiorhodospiraceae bacterium]|nr:CDP-glycerol glycerophosphotransferase family protein [Ectothiorhodospiraceae bacterium]